MEMWKDMPGFEDWYEISSDGNARSKERRYINKSGRLIIKHSKPLKPIIGANGYIRFGLKKPNDDKVYKVLAHRKVAEAFIPNPNGLDEVGHWDDNRGNNIHTNLYWTTHADNINKAVSSGRIIFDSISKANKKKIYAILNDNIVMQFDSLTEAAKHFGVSIGAVSMAKNHGHKCCGYRIVAVDVNNTPNNSIEADKTKSSVVTAKEVILSNGVNEIYCNSLNSAARKLGRTISSVINAAYTGTQCNGYNVYLCD